MTGAEPLNSEVVNAAQALYGTMNSVFEDWDSRDIPPDGYQAFFGYNIPRPLICNIQHDNELDLKSLGIHDLSSRGRWHISIGMHSAVGSLSLNGVSMPLAGSKQRLVFKREDAAVDEFNTYLAAQDRLDIPLDGLLKPNTAYVSTLLAKAGVVMPLFDLNPAERTLAIAEVAHKASVFDIVQKQSLPVHPTQEIVFRKHNSLSDPKQTARTIIHKTPRTRSHQPKQPVYDTSLSAVYSQTDDDGQPLYRQVVTFEGNNSQVGLPVVELETYERNPITGNLRRQRAKTNERVSAEMLSYIEAGLFDAMHGGKRTRHLPSEEQL